MLGRDTLGLIDSSSPLSRLLKGSTEKFTKFGEKVDAELNIAVFRHQLLRSQVFDKSKKAVQDRQIIIRARLLNSTDIVRLRAEREAKEDSLQEDKRSKKAASPMPSLDSTEIEG